MVWLLEGTSLTNNFLQKKKKSTLNDLILKQFLF